MRVPLDKSLGQWLRELMAEDKLYKFYKCREWMELRNQVLQMNHHECEDCRAKGIYTRAKLVHHEHEVRDYPEQALSMYYRDSSGQAHKNLWALCQNCHEVRHERMYRGQDNGRERRLREIEQRFPERW